MTNPFFENRLYTVKEAARILGVAAKTVRGWIKKFELRAEKKGGRYYIPG